MGATGGGRWGDPRPGLQVSVSIGWPLVCGDALT